MPRFRFEEISQAKLVVLYYRISLASESYHLTPYFTEAEANTSLTVIPLAFLIPGMWERPLQRQILCIDLLLKARRNTYIVHSWIYVFYSSFQTAITKMNLLAMLTICNLLSAPVSWTYSLVTFVPGVLRGASSLSVIILQTVEVKLKNIRSSKTLQEVFFNTKSSRFSPN